MNLLVHLQLLPSLKLHQAVSTLEPFALPAVLG